MNARVAIDETPCADARDDETVALRLAALSHPRRIQILRYLSSVEHCCCKEVVGQLDLAQSTVSQHLKVLVEAGLIRFVTDKQRSRYEVDRPAVAALSNAISRLLNDCC